MNYRPKLGGLNGFGVPLKKAEKVARYAALFSVLYLI